MSYSAENGFVPLTFAENMELVRAAINSEFGTTYTEESFVGTNWYKWAYSFCQRINLLNTKMSEIFAKLQQYITQTNLMVLQPTTTYDGLVQAFESEGFVVNPKPQDSTTMAGIMSLCVNLDDTDLDYETQKEAVLTLLDQYVSAGCFFTGTETGTIVIANGQAIPYAFHLPNRIPVLIKLSIETSSNSQDVAPPNEDIRIDFFEKLGERYRLGWNFAPDRLYTVADAPYAEDITIEYSVNEGSTWTSSVYASAFDDLFDFNLEDLTVLVDGA